MDRPVRAITFTGVKEPRLRFDKTAVGLVRRLQATLAEAVPDGKTVVVTITAPIRQDSKTGVVLAERIRKLLANKRARLETTIHGNRIQVRVLRGRASRASKLIGFVHNPEPNPAVLFEVARFLLECMSSAGQAPGGERWLITANRHGLAPIATVRQVGLALRARAILKRILAAESHA